jgi:hypothetical protein
MGGRAEKAEPAKEAPKYDLDSSIWTTVDKPAPLQAAGARTRDPRSRRKAVGAAPSAHASGQPRSSSTSWTCRSNPERSTFEDPDAVGATMASGTTQATEARPRPRPTRRWATSKARGEILQEVLHEGDDQQKSGSASVCSANVA